MTVPLYTAAATAITTATSTPQRTGLMCSPLHVYQGRRLTRAFVANTASVTVSRLDTKTETC
jgi:hypothetical protein